MTSKPPRKSSPRKKKPEDLSRVCSFCNKEFVKETSVASHMCKMKKRHFDKDTKLCRLALRAYVKFFTVHYPYREKPTYDQFIKSQVYDAFVRFAKYVLDIDATAPDDFIDYMVKSGVGIDKWCSDAHYEKFTNHLAMIESPDRALERTFLLIQQWAITNNQNSKDFFRMISPARGAMWLRNGRISPWVILNCTTGAELIGKFSDEQILMVSETLNTRVWRGKFDRFPEEVKSIREALSREGM